MQRDLREIKELAAEAWYNFSKEILAKNDRTRDQKVAPADRVQSTIRFGGEGDPSNDASRQPERLRPPRLDSNIFKQMRGEA